MRKLNVLLLLLALAGCGEVTVFGHVVRQGHPKAEGSEQSSSAASSVATALVVTQATSSSSSSHSAASSAPPTPVKPPVNPTQPSPLPASIKTTTVGDKANSGIQHLKTVTLSIAPEMMDKIAVDSRFNSKILLQTIKTELQSRQLLDRGDDSSDRNETAAGATLSIYIDNYDLHATTNFIIFGVKPHTGTLAGNLVLRDEQGGTTPIAHVEAYSRISLPESGEDKNVLQPLYNDFAVTVANSLAGTHVSTSGERDQPPR